MRFHVSRHFLLTCSALSLAALLFAACGTSLHLDTPPTAPPQVQDFSSAIVAGEEITVSPGQAVVLYADHLPQAGGSGDEAVSKAALHNQLNVLAHAAPFAKIPAVWGISKQDSFWKYMGVFYLGTFSLPLGDAQLEPYIKTQRREKNQVATH